MLIAILAVAGLAVGALLTLDSMREPRLSGGNNVHPSEPVVSLGEDVRFCQRTRIPAGTGAIEMPLEQSPEPGALRLIVADADGRELAQARDGRRGGWARFELNRTIRSGTIAQSLCVRQVDEGRTPAIFRGSLAERNQLFKRNAPVDGAVTISYLRPGSESVLAMLPVVAERIGLLREVVGGPARAVLLVILVLAGIALTAVLLSGRLSRRAAWWCALVAVLNACSWALLTPSFQTPDEPFHTSYVQDLAVKGTAPRPADPPQISPELIIVAGAAQTGAINFNPYGRPIWDPAQANEWEASLATHPSTRNQGSSGNVIDYPPLYYSSLVPAYALGHGLGFSTLGSLTLMRATSALYAGVAVLAIFLLLLELFPGRRWLAVAISLICAYLPVLTWISGGVNPDGALIAATSVMFWLIARGFRRGLTPRLALGLGLLMVAVYLIQIRSLGLGPGWAAALALLLWKRTPPDARLRTLAAAVLPAAAVLVAYCALNVLVWDRPLIPGGIEAAASGDIAAPPERASSGLLSYLWQYLFPPVGSMTNFFGVGWTVRDLWVPMWVGKFGWYDYQFPTPVNRLALGLYTVIGIAALAALVPRVRRIPTVRWLTIVYALLALGLLFAIARVGYPLRRSGTTIFEQARYFLPLIPLYALAFALASTWLKRWARPALTVFVGISILHLLFAFELTVQRYYF